MSGNYKAPEFRPFNSKLLILGICSPRENFSESVNIFYLLFNNFLI